MPLLKSVNLNKNSNNLTFSKSISSRNKCCFCVLDHIRFTVCVNSDETVGSCFFYQDFHFVNILYKLMQVFRSDRC